MISPIRLSIEKEHLLHAIDHSLPGISKHFCGDLTQRLREGIPYLEKVKIVKKDPYTFKGNVTVDCTENRVVEIRFRYTFPMPIPELNSLLGEFNAEEQKGFLRDTLKITVMNEEGKVLKGDIHNRVIQYLRGSVPYAIAYLEEQIDKTGRTQGIFSIPRTHL